MARYGSQASNLSGLLSNIAGSFEGMANTGNQYIDTFRRSMAPQLDTNDPQSMKAYADWAMRNGDEDTARRYQIAAGEIERTRQQRDALAKTGGYQRSLDKLEEARAAALANAGGDEQAMAQINSQYDTAVNAVASKADELSVQHGLDTTGAGMLEGTRKRVALTAEIKSMIEGTDDQQAKAQLKRILGGLNTNVLSPEEAMKAALDIEADSNKTSAHWGDAVRFANDYNASRGLKPGDEGYMTPSEAYAQHIGSVTDASARGALSAATESGKLGAQSRYEDVSDAMDVVIRAKDNIALYQEAIELLETGNAETGAIENMFLSVTADTLALENIRNKLGLSVVAGGKFGQLTEKELELALATGLPTGMQEEELANWLRDKIAVEQKLMNKYHAFMRWSEKTGGTLAQYHLATTGEEFSDQLEKENEPSGASNDGADLRGDSESGTRTEGGFEYEVDNG